MFGGLLPIQQFMVINTIYLLDEYSRFTRLYPLISKHEVFNYFIEFQKMIEKSLDLQIKCIQADYGGEFFNSSSNLHCKNLAIKHRFSCLYTPKQNDLVERKHGHLVSMVRCVLSASDS